jgi:hypothetical protein
MASRQREGGAGANKYAVEVLGPKSSQELPGI